MNNVQCTSIQNVLVYAGHRVSKPWNGRVVEEIVGPYLGSVDAHFSTFESINERTCRSWDVQYMYGDQIVETLSQANLDNTLLVIPAGESTKLDHAFSKEEIHAIQRCVLQGLKLYATCGGAYWLSNQRIWDHRSSADWERGNPTFKKGLVNIFPGTAIGPLSPYPDQPYSTAFFHEAVRVETRFSVLHVLSSGGGSFFLRDEEGVESIAKYSREELQRLGKNPEWENAVVSCEYGKGKAILSMVHPGKESENLKPEEFELAFPHRKDDWKRIERSLSSENERMNFISEVLQHFETGIDARL